MATKITRTKDGTTTIEITEGDSSGMVTALQVEQPDEYAPEAAPAPPAAAQVPMQAVPPKQPAMKQPAPQSEPKAETQPERKGSGYSWGDFDHMGGVQNISDPDADKTGVFKFQMPREEINSNEKKNTA
jgi:hypothetical protein